MRNTNIALAEKAGARPMMEANPKHRDFYIVNGGAELKWIITDPPGNTVASNSGTMTKQ